MHCNAYSWFINCNYQQIHLAWDGHFCEKDADGCLQSPCAAEVSCTDIPAPGVGATCGPCPLGFSGDGQQCTGIHMQADMDG